MVGQCLSGFGGGPGFCYVHMPTSCFDRIESENFRDFQNPDRSMYISFEACRQRLNRFGGSFGFGPLINPGFGKEISKFAFLFDKLGNVHK